MGRLWRFYGGDTNKTISPIQTVCGNDIIDALKNKIQTAMAPVDVLQMHPGRDGVGPQRQSGQRS